MTISSLSSLESPSTALIDEYFESKNNKKPGEPFESDYFVIPEFQREYVWTKEQCAKLFDDIKNFGDETSSNSEPYFLGCIIIEKHSESHEIKIIDGQQRTTTFLLLLKALLICISEKIENIKVEIEGAVIKKNLEQIRASIFDKLYKLKNPEKITIDQALEDLSLVEFKFENKSMNDPDKDDFTKLMYCKDHKEICNEEDKDGLLGPVTDPVTDKVKRFEGLLGPLKDKGKKFKTPDTRYTKFRNNFIYFYDELKKPEHFDSTFLLKFANTLKSECQIVVIPSKEESQALAMFNSLNSTGQPLSNANIIVGMLYGHCKDDKEREDFVEKWKNINKDVNELSKDAKIDIDSIFQQYMYIHRAQYRDTNKYSVRKYFENKIKTPPIDTLDALCKLVDIWKKILKLPVVRILLKFNDNIIYYFMICIYAHNEYFNISTENPDKDRISQCAEWFIKIFAIMAITRRVFTDKFFKDWFYKESIRIYHNDIEEIFEILKNHIQGDVFPDLQQNEEQILALLNSPISRSSDCLVYLNEYLFWKELKSEDDFFWPENNNINIEHIMPQAGKNIDLDSVRIDAGFERDDQDGYNEHLEMLGNKILLEEEINKSLGKSWFSHKISHSIKATKEKGYVDSSFYFAKNMVDNYKNSNNPSWTKKNIEDETKKGANRIIKFIFS